MFMLQKAIPNLRRFYAETNDLLGADTVRRADNRRDPRTGCRQQQTTKKTVRIFGHGMFENQL